MKPCACIACLCMIATIALRCSDLEQVSGIEITNGNCVGKIYTADGVAAENALVRLIPSGFNPYSRAAARIDSTYTNARGDFGFMVSQPDYYNIVAEKGSASCMQDSIFVQEDAKTITDNDTLRESGTLSGTVRLKPGDDCQTAVILVLGANVYTVPSDASGRFSTPLLPKGNYTIQVFTTLPGYAIFDTVVTIIEGAQTQLDVTLPSVNAPTIARLSASYDSATMFVSLSWPTPDTSKIVSYAVYRKSRLGKDTMWIIDKSTHSFADDIIGFDGDTVSYAIAGIGKNYKEGYRTTTQAITVCGKVYCTKKIDLSLIAAGLSHLSGISVFSDRENEIFLTGAEGIYKLDSNGVVQKDYIGAAGNLWRDNMGHLCCRKREGDTLTILQFDRDLNVLAEPDFFLGAPNPGLRNRSVVVAGNGMIFTFDHCGSTYTEVRIHDASGVAIDTLFPDRVIYGSRCFGDTIVTYEYHNDQTSAKDKPYIHFYDTAFRQLSVFKAVDFSTSEYCTPRVCSSLERSQFIPAANGVFVFIAEAAIKYGEASVLLFTDSNGKFLARTIVPAYWNREISFDASGKMYIVAYQYSDADDVSDNPMKTLYIYSLAPLFSAKSP